MILVITIKDWHLQSYFLSTAVEHGFHFWLHFISLISYTSVGCHDNLAVSFSGHSLDVEAVNLPQTALQWSAEELLLDAGECFVVFDEFVTRTIQVTTEDRVVESEGGQVLNPADPPHFLVTNVLPVVIFAALSSVTEQCKHLSRGVVHSQIECTDLINNIQINNNKKNNNNK